VAFLRHQGRVEGVCGRLEATWLRTASCQQVYLAEPHLQPTPPSILWWSSGCATGQHQRQGKHCPSRKAALLCCLQPAPFCPYTARSPPHPPHQPLRYLKPAPHQPPACVSQATHLCDSKKPAWCAGSSTPNASASCCRRPSSRQTVRQAAGGAGGSIKGRLACKAERTVGTCLVLECVWSIHASLRRWG